MAGTQNEPSSSGVHDGLAGTLAESIVEVGTPVLSEVVASERLTTVLVDTLENLFFEEIVSPLYNEPRGFCSYFRNPPTL